MFLAQGDTVGCTYSWACNFNPNASVDDGSCLLPPSDVPGPTIPMGGAPILAPTTIVLKPFGTMGAVFITPLFVRLTSNNGMTEVQDILLLLGAFGQSVPLLNPTCF